MRHQMPDDFLVCFADTFEKAGVAALRAAMAVEPEAYSIILRRVVSSLLAERIESLGDAVPDDVLEEIVSRTVAGIRQGTAAEGRPPRERLN